MKNLTMQDLTEKYSSDLVPVRQGSVMEVEILSKSRQRILVDAAGLNLGIIPEKEFSSDVVELKAGDKILAYVLMVENDDGFVVFSLRRADRERFVKTLEEKFASQETIKVRLRQANRGGLIAEYGNIEGFLPVSQLSSLHYPKVGDNPKAIVEKLNQLVGQFLNVKVINFDKASNKVIFSEKAAGDDFLKEKAKQFKVGQKLEGKITAVVDFGLFVDIGGIDGLVHISEVSWDRVNNLKTMFRAGDKVKTEIISIDNDKISLSIKQLLPDPWLNKVKKYKVGGQIKGQVIRLTPFGVFVELDEKVNGLVHISELAEKLKKEKTKIENILQKDKNYQFKILSIEPETHKINLCLAEEKVKKDQIKKSAKKLTTKKKDKKK